MKFGTYRRSPWAGKSCSLGTAYRIAVEPVATPSIIVTGPRPRMTWRSGEGHLHLHRTSRLAPFRRLRPPGHRNLEGRQDLHRRFNRLVRWSLLHRRRRHRHRHRQNRRRDLLYSNATASSHDWALLDGFRGLHCSRCRQTTRLSDRASC